MKKHYSFNNNASDFIQSKYDSNLSYKSEIFNMIRSIVDKLYKINKDEILSENDVTPNRHIRFTTTEITDQTGLIPLMELYSTKTSVKPELILSSSLNLNDCLQKSQLKFDSSISTYEQSSIQCHNATQTMDIIDLTNHQNLWIHSRKSLVFNLLPSSNIAHQYLVPGKGKYENRDIDDQSNEFIKLNNCSKRKLSERNFSLKRFVFSKEKRKLEELDYSSLSLQLMLNDNIIYIDDLINLFLEYSSHFHRILVKRYHVPPKQAILTSKIIEYWWRKYQIVKS